MASIPLHVLQEIRRERPRLYKIIKGLLAHQEEIEKYDIGHVEAHFHQGEVKLKIRHDLPDIS